MTQLKNSNFLNKEVFTLSEVYSYTGFEKTFVIKICSQRQIPHCKPAGNQLFFDKREIVAWLKADPITVQSEDNEMVLFDEMLEKFNRKN